MHPKLSPLKLDEFAILNCHYKFIPFSKDSINMAELFSSYEIDIDFARLDESYTDFRVFVKVSINGAGVKQKEGHEIFAEGVGIFSMVEDKNMTEIDKASLFGSSVQIAIGSLRSFISTLTSSVPMAKYVLPPLDLNSLILQRIELERKNKAKVPVKKGSRTKK